MDNYQEFEDTLSEAELDAWAEAIKECAVIEEIQEKQKKKKN